MDENRVSVPADPGGAMLFVFSMEVISFWAVYLDVFSEGTYLVLGCLMLAVYPVYLIGAFIYYKRNDAYMGNCYFIFGSLFGGIFGLIYIALHFGFLFGWDMNISILAIPMFWGSLAVFALLKPMFKGPVIPLVVYGIAAIWLFTYGLELLSVGSLIIFTVNKYLSLIVGVGTAYLFVNDLLLSAGDRGLPMGPLLGH